MERQIVTIHVLLPTPRSLPRNRCVVRREIQRLRASHSLQYRYVTLSFGLPGCDSNCRRPSHPLPLSQLDPSSPGTHWYQCRLLLREPLAVNARQTLVGSMRMVANKSYSYDISLKVGIRDGAGTTVDGGPIEVEARISLSDQYYSQLQRAAAVT